MNIENIEIIEFYPQTVNQKTRFCKGTLHFYLPDLDLDIRGAFCLYNNGKCFVHMPGKRGFDHDAKSWVRYPCVSFTDREKTKKILEVAKQLAKDYIEKNVFN